METQLKAFDIPYERIAAVDGNKLAEHFDLAHITPHGLQITPSEIGCMLSHRRAWLRFLQSDADIGLILEDDVNLGQGLTEIIASGLPSLEGPSLINCETRFNRLELMRPSVPLPCARHQLWRIYATVGAGGYMMNKSAAAILRKELRKAHPVDHLLFGKMNGRSWHSVKFFQLSPAFVRPNDLLATSSDIEHERACIAEAQQQFWNSCKPRYALKLLRELLRLTAIDKCPIPFH